MPHIQRSVLVSPTYSIEDLPTDIGHESASDFLNAWTIGWDPRLIHSMGSLPEWKRNDTGSLELEDALVVVPEICRHKVDIPQRERLNLGRNIVVDSENRSRIELFELISEELSARGDAVTGSAPLCLEDFYALGYLVLQLQMMARKLRYSWNLDWLAFSEQVLSAANASLSGDADETERWLQASFDSLSQERDRYCSQQIHLLNVVLLAETTLGETLAQEIASSSTENRPINVLANASLLAKLQLIAPANWETLKGNLGTGCVSLIGGLKDDLEMNYLSHRSLEQALQDGRSAYQKLDVSPPSVFSQFSPGMGAILPGALRSNGFKGVLLNAWSGGKVPTKESAKIRWQSHADGETIDCVLGSVADASNAETFLHFISLVSKQLDYHHVPTVVLAHWPSNAAPAMQDLIRVLSRSPALGSFESVEKYFKTTNQPYGSDAYIFNQFQVPLPTDAQRRDLLQRRLCELNALRVRTERTHFTASLWNHAFPKGLSDELVSSISNLDKKALRIAGNLPDDGTNEGDELTQVSKELEELRLKLVHSISQSNGVDVASSDKANGFLIVNTASHARRVFLDGLPGVVDSSSSKRIFAASSHQGETQLVADLPPFGFIKVRATGIHPQSETRRKPLFKQGLWGKLTGAKDRIADSDWTLTNEFMEVQIDPKKGHLRSVFVPSKRGSRISGMISLVVGPPQSGRKWQEEDFLVPRSVSVRLAENSNVKGVIEVVSQFMVDPRSNAGKSETSDSAERVQVVTRYTLWKGARWVEIDFDYPASTREAYYAVWRTAWANEGAILHSWQQGTKGKMPLPLQGITELIEIDDVENKTYLATCGLSNHQRFGSRYLVTILPDQTMPANASTTSSRMDSSAAAERGRMVALGMDWPRPRETCLDMLETPLWCYAYLSGTAVDEGAWLAQSSIPNVQVGFERNGSFAMSMESSRSATSAVSNEIAAEGSSPSETNDAGRFESILWVEETRGKRGTARLSFLKEVEEAWVVNANDERITQCDLEKGSILLNVHAGERCRIAVRWSDAQ